MGDILGKEDNPSIGLYDQNDRGELKDGGLRENQPTGAMREPATDRGRYSLISPVLMSRLAIHYEKGARKYAERNWEKGIPADRMFDSAQRHLWAWLTGDNSEDHLAAAIWNIGCIMHFEETKPEMINIPSREEYAAYLEWRKHNSFDTGGKNE